VVANESNETSATGITAAGYIGINIFGSACLHEGRGEEFSD
jgi:hypothetical protein